MINAITFSLVEGKQYTVVKRVRIVKVCNQSETVARTLRIRGPT